MIPCIFNDVIGPVMRGPSSSHCAAALRLGRLARDLWEGDIEQVLIQFDRHGSLATTHESQGSDMGLFAGLLGWEATDDRLPEAARTIRAGGVKVEIEIGDFGFEHPNTYRIELRNAQRRHVLTGISTGGGMIEVVAIDETPVSLLGDYYDSAMRNPLDFGGGVGFVFGFHTRADYAIDNTHSAAATGPTSGANGSRGSKLTCSPRPPLVPT